MLGCVDTPTAGTLLFDGRDVATLSDRERSLLRLRPIGFVFQRFFLLPMLTAAENVELPQSEAGVGERERGRARANCSTTSGSSARADHRPSQLSGGEMQRVAIARALANRPRLLLADEPTGELDQATGEQIAALLDRVNADGTALVIVTHDHALADRARRRADDARRPRRKRAHAVIGRLALRSLTAHPVRSARAGGRLRRRRGGDGHPARRRRDRAAAGAVARARRRRRRADPASAPQMPARLLLAGTLQAEALRHRVRVGRALPHRRPVSARTAARASRVDAPRRHPEPGARAWRSARRAGIDAWRDTDADDAWTRQRPAGGACAQIDRFHPIPDAPAWADSWAEWLYFNGRAADARFYLTFLVGPRSAPTAGAPAGVRLQLERGGRMRDVQRAARELTDAEVDTRTGPDDRRQLGARSTACAIAFTST